ncbi:GNAT family N-acetyltransferase [Geminicoccaceae bacterium 1502E]|nr:GNAT family N-acetyltransferase [Geminicoccaceae bacterium 1502E]
MLEIRRAEPRDTDAVWRIIEPVLRRGDTYALDPALDREAGLELWMRRPAACFVAERGGVVQGTYYIKPNQAGPGAHVCNAGFMVDPQARRGGTGRAMGRHALEAARGLGFHAMQFNMVVASNRHAVALWQDLGFSIVGTLPEAFRHPEHGLVDAHVMYRKL